MSKRLFAVLAVLILSLTSAAVSMAQLGDLRDPVRFGETRILHPIDDDEDADGDDEIGDRVAGTYLIDADLAPGIFPPGQGLQTLTETGELISTDNAAFAGINPLAPQFIVPIFGPGHGAWIQTGIREITNTALIQGFYGPCPPGPDCDPGLVGQQQSTCQPTATVVFDEDYETASGSLTTVCFFVGDDPLDPASVPFFDSEALFGPGTISYRRVTVD